MPAAKSKTEKKEPKKTSAKPESTMKTLGNLSPAKGSNIKKKRLGRGPGSGLGKTSARGGKGQTARKGGGIRFGFEGGQTPMYRRLPKRGFSNVENTNYSIVNIEQLGSFKAGSTVTVEDLKKAGLIKCIDKVKLLGNGALKTGLTVKVHKCSASAKAAVEKAGGKVEEI